MPSEQDSQPKPAKRARTSFTAEQLQVPGEAASGRPAVGRESVWAGLRGSPGCASPGPRPPGRRGGAVDVWGVASRPEPLIGPGPWRPPSAGS